MFVVPRSRLLLTAQSEPIVTRAPIRAGDPSQVVAEAIELERSQGIYRLPSRYGLLGERARRVVLRLLRPYSTREASIDRAILHALVDLDRRLSVIEGSLAAHGSELEDAGGPQPKDAREPAPAASGPGPEDARGPEQEEPHWLIQQRRDDEGMSRVIAGLAPTANCIDVGAHKGDVLAQMIAAAPRGRHIAYEPLPHLHGELAARFPEVDVRCVALSNSSGSASFLHYREAEGWSGLRYRPLPGADTVAEIPVCLEVLDETLPAGYVPTLIKIDVEGAEQQVLEGALRTLKRHKPLVIFEHGHGAAEAYGTSPEDIYGLLVDDAGLRISGLDGGKSYSLAEFKEIFYSAERVNFLAHP